jgi:regulator of protease activity HflC (stomatin/prohibitin superfamily)
MFEGLFIVVVAIVALAAACIKIVPEYERALVFRLGRALGKPKGPGVIIILPVIDRFIRISIRTITMDVEPQDIISRDNVSLKVNAVVYFRVVDPYKCIVNVENYLYATSQLAQTHLRSVLGQHTMDELLTDREKVNDKLQIILDQNTDPWGIKVSAVEVKHIDLPQEMQRAMAREAESERERRAKIINSEGELQAATKLKEAADLLSSNPMTLQLRYLQTISDISSDQNTKIVFPFPIEFLKIFDALKK